MSDKRSVLDYIKKIIPKNKEMLLIKNSSRNIVETVINFFELLENNFDEKDVDILLKKFVLAIKQKNADKFMKKINNIIMKKESEKEFEK